MLCHTEVPLIHSLFMFVLLTPPPSFPSPFAAPLSGVEDLFFYYRKFTDENSMEIIL